MPRHRDPTPQVKQAVFDALDGALIGPAGPVEVVDGGNAGGFPHARLGPAFYTPSIFGATVVAQVDVWSASTDSREVDAINAAAVELLAALEGLDLGAGFTLTRATFLPSQTLDERELHGDATWHGVLRLDAQVFDAQSGALP